MIDQIKELVDAVKEMGTEVAMVSTYLADMNQAILFPEEVRAKHKAMAALALKEHAA